MCPYLGAGGVWKARYGSRVLRTTASAPVWRGRQSSIGPVTDPAPDTTSAGSASAEDVAAFLHTQRRGRATRRGPGPPADGGPPAALKLGIDPTAPDIHLGHTVILRKLREFQDLGHTVVLIVGDYTARVGDPSGRSSARPMLSGEEIDANAETFRRQASTVLDPDRTEMPVTASGST